MTFSSSQQISELLRTRRFLVLSSNCTCLQFLMSAMWSCLAEICFGNLNMPPQLLDRFDFMVNICKIRSHTKFIDQALDREGPYVILGFLPFFHAYGMIGVLAGSLMYGRTVVTLPRFESNLFLCSIEKYKVTHLLLVPPVVVFMAKHPMVNNYDLSSLKRVTSAAAPLAPDVEAQFKAKVNIADMRQGYGLTETTCSTSAQPVSKPPRPGSIGVPFANTEMQILDIKTGKYLGPNKEGEVWIRGPNVMKGYLNNPDATNSTIDENGWLRAGDIGYFDEDCYFYIVDRIKELIKYKGFQVAPAELEALLLTHPNIADAGVIGIPDASAGEIPKAYVVLKNNVQATQDEIKQFVAERLAQLKHLRGGVEFVIPKSPSG